MMIIDYFERLSFGEKEYFWKYARCDVESIGSLTYRVFELSAYYDIYQKGFYKDIFEDDWEPPTFFIPLEVMSKNNTEIIDWCDNFCTTCAEICYN